jgi:soluble P-type ATPase
MTLTLEIPGRGRLELAHLLLDVNGTLSNRGALISGVAAQLGRLRGRLRVHLLSADTFGTLEAIAAELQVEADRVAGGEEKLRQLRRLGSASCAVIGNGANDVLALEAAALGIAVIGPEGASAAALRAADVVCASVQDALALLLDPAALAATLRP